MNYIQFLQQGRTVKYYGVIPEPERKDTVYGFSSLLGLGLWELKDKLKQLREQNKQNDIQKTNTNNSKEHTNNSRNIQSTDMGSTSMLWNLDKYSTVRNRNFDYINNSL